MNAILHEERSLLSRVSLTNIIDSQYSTHSKSVWDKCQKESKISMEERMQMEMEMEIEMEMGI